MAKPRLKVYRAQMGFAEAVVAAPSQKAALQAWGARQNLFAEGLAAVTEDPAAVADAVARPGVVLQRPVGAHIAFTETLTGHPEAPPPRPRPVARARPAAAPKSRPKPDRSALIAAEQGLAALETEAKTALAALAQRRERLDAEATELQRDLDGRRVLAQRRLETARRAFEAA